MLGMTSDEVLETNSCKLSNAKGCAICWTLIQLGCMLGSRYSCAVSVSPVGKVDLGTTLYHIT
eukprot:4101594-Amphidinium_carterae.1